MTPAQIRDYLKTFEPKRDRTIAIVDFANVEKWKHSLHWNVGIQELATLVKNFSHGKRYLRRFYYGSDYGKNESSVSLEAWSQGIIARADANGFQVVTKRVKYIHSADNVYGFEKKCDLDVEMTVDLIKERDNYDTAIMFSGDGDLAYAMNYLHEEFSKQFIVFGARDHVGRELFDAQKAGAVSKILFAEDFEYRLNMHRNRR
jgi:uncharacterized LabA/DUF88 family protein